MEHIPYLGQNNNIFKKNFTKLFFPGIYLQGVSAAQIGRRQDNPVVIGEKQKNRCHGYPGKNSFTAASWKIKNRGYCHALRLQQYGLIF